LRLATPVVLLALLAACGTSAPPNGETDPEHTEDAEQEEDFLTSEETESEEQVSARGQGGTLRLFYHQAPTTLNPHLSQSNKDLNASRITYEPLASFDKNGEMVPFLATEVPSLDNGGVASDGTSVTWQLKEDVLWSDGEPFTADDVLFTYEYVSNPDVASTSAAAYAGIDSVEVLDEDSVRVNFKAPTAAWFLPFVGPQGMILPRHVFEEHNGPDAADAAANLLPVGTGPYRVTDFVEEDILIIGDNAVSTVKIVYEANPFFREPDKPFFGTVELQGGGDINLAVLATKEGLVDFAWNIRVGEEALTDMESGGNAVAVVALGPFVERIMINFTDPNSETAGGERSSVEFPHPFLTDEAVRQAIALAIDREAVADVYGRSGRFTPNIATQPAYIDSPNTSYEYNPARAELLLEEAGWVDSDGDGIREKDGVELRILFQTSIEPLRQFAQQQVKSDLEAIGFEVELKTIDSSIFFGSPENTIDTRRQFYGALHGRLDLCRDCPAGERLGAGELGSLLQPGIRCLVRRRAYRTGPG
jgi:peptide/nickel transport system substrate-binding protein